MQFFSFNYNNKFMYVITQVIKQNTKKDKPTLFINKRTKIGEYKKMKSPIYI